MAGLNGIAGVVRRRLTAHRDTRGYVAELFRTDWGTGVELVQWHVLNSAPGVLRGIHLHLAHTDYKIVVAGHQLLALLDLRLDSPSEGAVELLELSADDPVAVMIPPGVGHGLYSYDQSASVVGVTALYDGTDDFACLWSDPAHGITWPAVPTIVSDRDAGAPTLAELRSQLGERLRLAT
jgi:dTDP-4-dehydrorhamnose 3,5-epimerase